MHGEREKHTCGEAGQRGSWVMGKLYPLVGRRNPKQLQTKLTFIKTIMIQLTYGSAVWRHAAMSNPIMTTPTSFQRFPYIRNANIIP